MSLIEMLQIVVLMTSIVVLPGLFAIFIVFFPMLLAHLWGRLWETPTASRDCGYRGQRQTRAEQSDPHGPRASQKKVPPKLRPPDPFQAACKLLGLAIPHDEPAFRAAYRRAIMHTHPDLGGSTVAAPQVKSAADLIRQRKADGTCPACVHDKSGSGS